ncbi:MAG: N-acetyl-gamma-glutamyl-phosphate reductase [Rhodothermia bacterium]|nr:N-acetyl-gamma-glutamyl-phosphate reductase [Rhodothermia bacterium]
MTPMKRIGILHGAGYTGGELIRLVTGHPYCELSLVTSRSFSGKPLSDAHPSLAGTSDLQFADPAQADARDLDAVLIAAEHGQGAHAVLLLLRADFAGAVVDLSADFRFQDPTAYPRWFGFDHPAPALLQRFVYGLPEVRAPYPEGTTMVANPGCFATALSLALWPLARADWRVRVSVTALTGASGSGAKPKPTTHYPTRDGNVRAYKIFQHQHQPEVEAVLGDGVDVDFVPVSGPWTRGIWGTAHVDVPEDVDASDLGAAFEAAYGEAPLVRVWPEQLPELRYAVGTPFFDVGWMISGRHAVIGFAIDNLLKGAASQAIQNLNLLLDLPETAGLIPERQTREAIEV